MTGLPSVPRGTTNWPRKSRSESSRSSCRAKVSSDEKFVVMNQGQTSDVQCAFARLRPAGRNLHELDRSSIRITHVDDALTGIGSFREDLGLARCFPA